MNIEPERIRTFLADRSRVELMQPRLTHAGVLMLLFPKEGELQLLLTKRTVGVEHHKGQISFPGGSLDETDDDIVATALREAEEEIGLQREQVQVLGLFDDVWTPSGFRITPVIGYTPVLPSLRPNTEEVEEILEVPLSFFLKRENEQVKKFQRNGEWIDVYFYRRGPNEIWGATAGMVRSFLLALQDFLHRF